MALHFFSIPALDPQPAQDDLNRFCAGRRVVAVERQFVAAGTNSFWAVCVTVAEGAGPLPDALKAPERRSGARSGAGGEAGGRIDYKAVLSEADFAVYAELRAWRKTAAEREGVPVYAVFTNEQLAEIVRRGVDTLAALAEIEGIGPARLERYGEAVLTRLRERPAAEGNGDAA
jgi:superfamily II DNA helicase RecQ